MTDNDRRELERAAAEAAEAALEAGLSEDQVQRAAAGAAEAALESRAIRERGVGGDGGGRAMKFRTADGYTLIRVTEDGVTIWVDRVEGEERDVTFDAGEDGLPVDSFGEPVEGRVV
jgi:hypothetical protein